MNKDLFEDVKNIVKCDYISDLPYRKKEVVEAFKRIDFRKYDAVQVKEFMAYIYGR